MLHNDFRTAGWRVFGLHGATDGKCDCGNPKCEAVLKHPLAANWQHTPDWSDDQWQVCNDMGQFKTGYGVVMRGIFVIDVDARNGGVASYSNLVSDFPEIAGAGLIVNTGSGGGSKHLYFLAPDGNPPMVQHLDKYKGIDFKSSGYVVGPGSLHESGNTYDVAFGSIDDIDTIPQSLVDALKKPEHFRAEIEGEFADVSAAEIVSMLKALDPNMHHDDWIRVGMGVHHATGGDGLGIWDTWSQGGDTYPDSEEMNKRWHSFGKSSNPVTLGTVIHMAEAAGWLRPVTFDSDVAPELTKVKELSLDTSGVDLSRPPGFTGEVVTYFNACSIRLRERLAVGAALYVISNLIGMRYIDDLTGVSPNFFALCVSGSGSGKNAIQEAISEFHRVAGISGAEHGSIKSEQELMRNLIEHQAAFYNIDEIGEFLRKIKNAQKSGGASYLEGIKGILMSAYSKANGYMKTTGDLKRDMKAMLLKDIAAINNSDDVSDAMDRKEARLLKQLNEMDDGLRQPYVSLIGFTVPETFDEIMDRKSATDGFLRRTMVFREHDNAPRHKKNFKKAVMSEIMANTVRALYVGDTFSMDEQDRVEYTGAKHKIPTQKDAVGMLEMIADHFDDEAIAHEAKTGMESLFLGGYEMVSKISLILAAPGGVRTAEHVIWAFAFVCRDIEDKTLLAVSEDTQKTDPKTSLELRLVQLCGSDEGTTEGVLINKCRKFKREDVVACLTRLVDSGNLVAIATGKSRKGHTTLRYRKKS